MEWRKHHWFYTPESLDCFVGKVQAGPLYHPIHGRDLMLGKLMLIVTEISESSEAQKNKDMPNWREEIADTAIRILDVTTALNIDMDGNLEMVSVPEDKTGIGLVNCISKAAEFVRKDNLPGIAIALTEAFRILLIVAERHNFDLYKEMESKMKVNWQRPIKHGKLCSL